MRLAIGLLCAHGAAVAFALAGMLIALRMPELWAGTGGGDRVFSLGMRHGGTLHILFGAAAVFAFGVTVLGTRRTAIFCTTAVTISLAAELIGTGTGWPFGNYVYGDALGAKILGQVPFTIPLSWFYLGLTSYLLGRIIVDVHRLSRGWAVPLGVWFLVVWDLVLDPAMAHPRMPIQFWLWRQDGVYLGMPLQNFAGWALTGAAFMVVNDRLWGDEIDARRVPVDFVLVVYALNMLFAIVLAASVGLWPPIALAVGLGLVPASLARRAWMIVPAPGHP